MNGKVVITPVPGTGNNPPVPATTAPKPPTPVAQVTVTQAVGKAVAVAPPLTNGGGAMVAEHVGNNGDCCQVRYLPTVIDSTVCRKAIHLSVTLPIALLLSINT